MARQGSAGRARRRGTGTPMFALTVPGLASVLRAEVDETDGLSAGATGCDRRADVVRLTAGRGARGAALGMRVAEDVFVEVGHTRRGAGDPAATIARRLWRDDLVPRALSAWADESGPLSASLTFRVVTRVLDERAFLRTDLRRRLTEAIQRDRPRWRGDDPARLEVWAVEYAPGRFVAGLRLSDAAMRQHHGREVEREGALRPAVAAAMVRLAGAPDGTLLDPCCGSGTILGEAVDAGWQAAGTDIDPDAVRAATTNVPAASARTGDARDLDAADASVAAYVSNLPFGRQYRVPGDRTAWLRTVLGEAARVTRPGGRVVLLVPDLPRAVVPPVLRRADRLPVRLLGARTSVWAFDRVSDR
ncbi:MAG: methyltransferase domain-containing protein [Acidothermales bacterium]|nr:methyltransferase domain-containing protein [Acidothermales bacterium]